MSNRLAELRNALAKNPPAGGLDAILISSVSHIIYLTNYAGFSKDEREAYLFITNNKQYILTDGRYAHAVRTLIPDFKLIGISSKVSFEKILKDLAKKHKIKRIGFDHHNITVAEHEKLSSCFSGLPRREAGLNHFSLDNLRVIKDEKEISAIEKACQLGDKTFKYILKKIKLGVSEKELANEIEFFIRKRGAGISFLPIVAFGTNSAIPHHAPTNNKLTNNQIVLLDFGVKLNNYCSDMTRTVFFGQPTPKQKRIYQTVLKAQSLAIKILNTKYLIHNTIKASEVDRVARDYIISKGYKTIPHSVGHGIGIDVHESPHISPKSKDVLKNGMVFSIEPGIYLENFGGVRIEDLIVLDEDKVKVLTKSSKDLIIV